MIRIYERQFEIVQCVFGGGVKRLKNGRKRVLGTESDEYRFCGWREIRDVGDWRGQQWSRGSLGWEQFGIGSIGFRDCVDFRENVREELGFRGFSQEYNRQGFVLRSLRVKFFYICFFSCKWVLEDVVRQLKRKNLVIREIGDFKREDVCLFVRLGSFIVTLRMTFVCLIICVFRQVFRIFIWMLVVIQLLEFCLMFEFGVCGLQLLGEGVSGVIGLQLIGFGLGLVCRGKGDGVIGNRLFGLVVRLGLGFILVYYFQVSVS